MKTFMSNFSHQDYLRSDASIFLPPGAGGKYSRLNLELESRHITKFEINLGGQRQSERETRGSRKGREGKEGEFNLKISAGRRDRPTAPKLYG